MVQQSCCVAVVLQLDGSVGGQDVAFFPLLSEDTAVCPLPTRG